MAQIVRIASGNKSLLRCSLMRALRVRLTRLSRLTKLSSFCCCLCQDAHLAFSFVRTSVAGSMLAQCFNPVKIE